MLSYGLFSLYFLLAHATIESKSAADRVLRSCGVFPLTVQVAGMPLNKYVKVGENLKKEDVENIAAKVTVEILKKNEDVIIATVEACGVSVANDSGKVKTYELLSAMMVDIQEITLNLSVLATIKALQELGIFPSYDNEHDCEQHLQ